jgi:hypothetical protein
MYTTLLPAPGRIVVVTLVVSMLVKVKSSASHKLPHQRFGVPRASYVMFGLCLDFGVPPPRTFSPQQCSPKLWRRKRSPPERQGVQKNSPRPPPLIPPSPLGRPPLAPRTPLAAAARFDRSPAFSTRLRSLPRLARLSTGSRPAPRSWPPSSVSKLYWPCISAVFRLALVAALVSLDGGTACARGESIEKFDFY